MAARIEPGYLDVNLAHAKPREVLNAVTHVCAQIFDDRGQRCGEDQSDVQVQDCYLAVEFTLGFRARVEVVAGTNSQYASSI